MKLLSTSYNPKYKALKFLPEGETFVLRWKDPVNLYVKGSEQNEQGIKCYVLGCADKFRFIHPSARVYKATLTEIRAIVR